MKITAYKTVDVECECDVDNDAIVAEFSQRVGEADADYWRRAIPAIDCITRILLEVKPEVIAEVPESGRAIVAKRLMDAAKAWRVEDPQAHWIQEHERIRLRPGDVVRVRDDNGTDGDFVVKTAPWQLGHGAWVIGLNGISGGYSLDRVTKLIRRAEASK